MIPSEDREYEKAKSKFIWDLTQLHESRGMHMKRTPKINGKEVDLYLLYQIVTSHGGCEKMNALNEWDDLLEHLHLPRATNGGFVLKEIYFRFLELYEKIHFLNNSVEVNRHRRRPRPSKQLFSPFPQNQQNQQNSKLPTTIQDHQRGQYGLSTKIVLNTEYDYLVLSLQCPMPYEQDIAISVCTVLSNNESKNVLKFHKNPQLLNLILGHAGIFNECSLRSLYQEAYSQAQGLSHKNFWNEHVSDPDIRQLLCECFVPREQLTLCQYNEDEHQIKYYPNLELDLEIINEQDLTDEEKNHLNFLTSRKQKQRKLIENEPAISPDVDQQEKMNILKACCALCCCQESESGKNEQHNSYAHLKISPSGSEDKIGLRILQISNILQNLSFDEDNALIMASNPSMLRFLLIAANCCWGQLPQLSYDMFGNLGKYIKLHEPTTDPISSMIMDLIQSGLYSNDRFKILRCLEALRELTKKEGNDRVIQRYFEKKMYSRLVELLSVSDIMLLIYTLECLLSLTNMGEAFCNDLLSVQGSVSTLVSLVTVEAQSYVPNGCISMSLVESLMVASQPQSAQHESGAAVTAQTINPPTVINTPPVVSESGNSQQPSSSVSSSSRLTLSTRLETSSSSSSFPSLSSSTSATGTTVVTPTQPQISTGLNNLTPKTLALPADTTATPVVAVPLIPSISTSNENAVTTNSSRFNNAASNAALHAINRRHEKQFMNSKELLDDNEGPVTKSIRLTSALILRNLVNFSDAGRKMCSSYESHFSVIAMSNVESSRTVSQILYNMNELDKKSRRLR